MKRIHNPEVRIAKMLKELGPLGLWATGAGYCMSDSRDAWESGIRLQWGVREIRKFVRNLNRQRRIHRAFRRDRKHCRPWSLKPGWNCWHGHTRYSTEEKAIKRELQRRRKLASH